jgi:hypothetical protein
MCACDWLLLSQYQDWWILGERRYYRPARISHVSAHPNCQLGAHWQFRLIVISIGAPMWITHLVSNKLSRVGNCLVNQTAHQSNINMSELL